MNAVTLIKCPVGIDSLVDHRDVLMCNNYYLWSIPDIIDFSSFSAESFVDGACPIIERAARLAAGCSLQAARLAEGYSMNLTAVEAAISASTVTTDSEKARQQAVLDECRDSGADTMHYFLDCWERKLAGDCVKFIAARVATAPTPLGPDATPEAGK